MSHSHQEELLGTTVADLLQMVDGGSDGSTTAATLPHMMAKLPQSHSKTLFDTLQEQDVENERNLPQFHLEYQPTDKEQTYSVLLNPQQITPQATKPPPPSRRKGANKLSPSEKAELDKKISAHIKIQELFAQELAQILDDPAAASSLQCCLTITNNKPCGCIRKYILNGSEWKKRELSANYLLEISPVLDIKAVCDDDSAMVTTHPEVLERATTLLSVYHKAAELKKEKWYKVEEEEEEEGGKRGPGVKVKRRYIGLGNGRKRSKRYEEFVLSQRNILRKEHFLCEKAAQKLLGYSINFLYKKLRTDPQKKSRLVATNNSDRASKVSRSLISLDRLQEISTQQTASCCIRNCISWFVKNHMEKIVSWRERLKDSGQRATQEIVREVYLMQDMDRTDHLTTTTTNSGFCLNLVHWITGCSFKKIRRVRDHLKVDPATLPEHGLKKYRKSGSSIALEAVTAATTPIQPAPKRIVTTNRLYQIPMIDTVWSTSDDVTTKPMTNDDVTSSTNTYLTVATVTVGKPSSGGGIWMPPGPPNFSQQLESSSSSSPSSSS